jgi:hypothetical protein
MHLIGRPDRVAQAYEIDTYRGIATRPECPGQGNEKFTANIVNLGNPIT